MQVSRVGLSMNHGDRCFTTDGFTDIGAGTQVKILDANGKVIALGELGAGSAVDKFEGVPGTEYCLFKASVPDVPLVDLFGVEVSHRGVVNFKRDGDPTEAALTLG
ncbi:hypothetical protein M3G03_10250 [Aestuariimicrobium sp. p3-SID1156]|uniref:hypothetical protein n=1 Tax=Aestuariimicrobium sp. p3-SID1156 TaxID=2916038 RepID=UPI00223A6921|nr:hypothetical protein [Aestuariimicrobium sp. p3-SID1156]MCT1459912.1 hypothetical protein [Aestuariimicrobium sp. p3-SID1156]